MLLASRGDSAALDELMQLHWHAVVDFAATRLSGNRDLAEDVAQDVFLRVWERRIVWKPGGSVRAFLFGVARNLSLNQSRRSTLRLRMTSRVKRLVSAWQRTPTPLEQLEAAESNRRLERALASLPERRREVFLHVRVHGLSYKEVADLLDLSPQTVANHMSAALSDLHRLL